MQIELIIISDWFKIPLSRVTSMFVENFSKEQLASDELFEKLRNITIAEVKTIIYKLEDVLASENLLIRIPRSEAIVVGDMHGDIAVCLAIAQKLLTSDSLRAIFLGDYVDRGPHQVDVINLVLLLKLTFMDRVVLLRGNHETPVLNETNGFRDCLSRQFGQEDGHILWYLYNRLFKQFALAAITWNDILLVHGGIPEHISDLSDIETLPKEYDPANNTILELLWNDPNESKKLVQFKKSTRGGPAREFGSGAFQNFVEKTKIKRLIRAHEEFNDGYKYFFDEKLISIFSSRRVVESPFEHQIKPKIIVIKEDGTINLNTIEPEPIKT